MADLNLNPKCWTHAEQKFAAALAGSAAFQGWGNYPSEVEASEAIGRGERRPIDRGAFLPGELEQRRAMGQVCSPLEAPYGKRRVNNRFVPYGFIEMGLYLWVPAAEKDAATLNEIEARCVLVTENIVDEIIAWIDQYGGPFIRDISTLHGPAEIPHDATREHGVWWLSVLGIEWGRPE